MVEAEVVAAGRSFLSSKPHYDYDRKNHFDNVVYRLIRKFTIQIQRFVNINVTTG